MVKDYSKCVTDVEFPFIDFKSQLFFVANHSTISEKTTVLELGIGNGLLTMLYASKAKNTVGLDFSAKMLELCKQNIPEIQLFKADVTKEFVFLQGTKYDRIISNYLFHEFDNITKCEIVKRCFDNHLNDSGFIVIGNISFADCTMYEAAKTKFEDLWDDEELYWNAEKQTETLRKLGFLVQYEQITPCSGVYIISRQLARPRGFEPLICGSGGHRSIQLSHGRIQQTEILDYALLCVNTKRQIGIILLVVFWLLDWFRIQSFLSCKTLWQLDNTKL